MPYRVLIEQPHIRGAYHWPGYKLEPEDMSKEQAEQVIRDLKRMDANRARYAGGQSWVGQYTLDWVKADRQLKRSAPRR